MLCVCGLQIARFQSVIRVTKPHFWKMQGETFIGTLHLEVEDDMDEHVLRKKVVAMLNHCGISQVRLGYLVAMLPCCRVVALLCCCVVALLCCCVVALLRCCVVALLRCCVVALSRCCVVVLLRGLILSGWGRP